MDPVRRDLYFSLLKSVLRRPPGREVVSNYLRYKWSGFKGAVRLSHYPVSLVFYANKICNFSCSFCYNRDVLNKPDSADYNLSGDSFRRIMESPFGKKALRIAFLGGEPFLNGELFEFLGYCAERGKLSNVVTNASPLRGALLERLVSSPVNVIGLSLYANNRQDVERVVRRLNQARKSYWVQTIGSAQDLGGLREAVLFCDSIGCRNLILSNYNPYFDGCHANVLRAGNPDYAALETELKARLDGRMNVQWINAFRGPSAGKTCRLPFSYIHVDSEGNIGPCCFRYPDRSRFGNIHDKDAWNAPEVLKLRQNLLSPGEAPLDQCASCENLSRDLYGI